MGRHLTRRRGLTLAVLGFVLATAVIGPGSAHAESFPSLIRTVAGTGGMCPDPVATSGSCGDGGAATAATLNVPNAVSGAADGSFLIADTGDQRIRLVSATGQISTVAGNGISGTSPDSGSATGIELMNPRGVFDEGGGTFLIADTDNLMVQQVAGGITTILAGGGSAGSGSSDNDGGDGSQASGSALRYPIAVTIAPDGDVIIADALACRLRRIAESGVNAGIIFNFAGYPATGTMNVECAPANSPDSDSGGPAASAILGQVPGVAAMSDGSILIADDTDNVIWKVEPGGSISVVAGKLGAAAGETGDGGPAVMAALDAPNSVAATPDGGFLIADTGDNVVRKVSSTGIITLAAGDGQTTYNGDEIPPTAAALDAPDSVWAAADGSYLIADAEHNRIRRVVPADSLTTTITLNPAAPTGSAGWYRGPVSVTASASASPATLTATRCAIDPPAAPHAFSDLPPGPCGLTSAPQMVSTDGAHTVDAASSDSFGNDEQIETSSFKIDATPPVVTCPHPPTVTQGQQTTLSAMVADATSGPAAATVQAPLVTSHTGTFTVPVTGADVAGNTATTSCSYTVVAATPVKKKQKQTSPRKKKRKHPKGPTQITASVTYNDTYGATTVFTAPTVLVNFPTAATLRATCAGPGCPFTKRTTSTSALCHTKRACGPKVPLAKRTESLLPLLKGHFHPGDTVDVFIESGIEIGRVFEFMISESRPVPRRQCTAPHSFKPRAC